MASSTISNVSYDPDSVRDGELPPWEIAKVFAFKKALDKIVEHTGEDAADLLGMRVDEWIRSQVTQKGGGRPTARSIRYVIARCEDPKWYPGKPRAESGGRPCVYTEHQKNEVARVAMELKRKIVAPTPRRVRARLPASSRRSDTNAPMSNRTMQRIFTSRCYDDGEDDPWQFLDSIAQDVLPETSKPRRVAMAEHIRNMPAGSWYNHVAIDPNSSLVPKTIERQVEMQVAAMGKCKYMSPGARRKGINPRAPSTAKKQANSSVQQFHWTPVFARGKIWIFVCNPEKAGPEYPSKLNDSDNLGKFIKFVLPNILQKMCKKYKWKSVPRTVVHDKASYMVSTLYERLNSTFAAALKDAGLTSWVGDDRASTHWMAGKFGDVYVHETAISHVRRLLDTDFMCTSLTESFAHFEARMKKVEDHMNSKDFAAKDGGGLASLATHLRDRCQDVINRQGERIPK